MMLKKRVLLGLFAVCICLLSAHYLQEFAQLMSIESVMPSNHPILYLPLLFLASVFPSIMVFSNKSALHVRWLQYWSFSFSICPSNEYSGLVSFRIDWFDLLKIQVNKMILGLFHSGISSVQFSRSVMSNSLRPHELQHTRPPCPSPAPGVHSDSQPWSQ